MNSPDWDTMFREVSRRRVGGGPKVTGAHEITWRGQIRGRRIDAVSRVRPINPMESFETSSGHRLRDSKVGDAGHWVDLRVSTPVTDGELTLITAAANDSGETRPIRVSRGRHAPIACHDGRL